MAGIGRGRLRLLGAVSVYAHEIGGARAVGLVWLLRMIPSAIGAPFLTLLGERHPGGRVIAFANVLLGVLAGATAAAIAVDTEPAVVYALAIVVAMITTVFWPAQAALLPSLARNPAELTAANTASITVEGVGSFVGPALCGLLLAAASVEIALAVTAAVFVVAAIPAARIATPSARSPERAETGRFRTQDLLGPLSAIARHPHLRVIVAYFGAWALAQGALNVLIVALALDVLEIGDGGVGLLTAAVGVGGVTGAFVSLAFSGRKRLTPYLAVGSVAFGAPLCVLATLPGVAATVLLLAVLGAGNLIVDVASLTLLQRTAPDEVLMRVMGIVEGLWVALFGLGAVAAPAAIEVLDVGGALALAGGTLAVAGLVAARRLRGVDTAGPAAEPLALLRGVPFLASLPAPALERLAGRLMPVNVVAGDHVFRQGERGDRFYVIAEGRAAFAVDGRPVASFVRGDFFGEIAVLCDTSRTGTVTAVTALELFALDRATFLSAISGFSERGAAEAVVEQRLARVTPNRPRGLVWTGPR